MITVGLDFFRPTKIMRELLVLLFLRESEHVSQHELARKVGVSSSMANNYMKSLVGQGMVATSGHTNRTMKYAVTDKGNDRVARLMSMYSREIARLYSIAKREVEKRFGEILVSSPSLIETFQPDAVLIASSGKAYEIRRQLQTFPKRGIAVVTL